MISQFVNSTVSTIVRGLLFLFIWGVTLAVLHNLNMAGMGNRVTHDIFFIALFLLIPSALILTGHILSVHVVQKNQQQSQRQPRMPARSLTDGLAARDLLALLDDDDLDDLRAEIRESLRERIRRLSEGDEPESFEALLADTAVKRKRGVR